MIIKLLPSLLVVILHVSAHPIVIHIILRCRIEASHVISRRRVGICRCAHGFLTLICRLWNTGGSAIPFHFDIISPSLLAPVRIIKVHLQAPLAARQQERPHHNYPTQFLHNQLFFCQYYRNLYLPPSD